VLRFAGFELDLDRAELRAPDGEAIRLRPKTFALLHLFATNANRLLTKQELMTAIWPNVHVGDDSLFQCIREIRSALRDKDRQIVKSVSGRGYLFEAEVVTVPLETAPEATPARTDDLQPPALDRVDQQPPTIAPFPAPIVRTPRLTGLRRYAGIAGVIVVFAVGMAAAAPTLMRHLSTPELPILTVLPFEARTSDAATPIMAANVTDRLTDGLSKIGNIRVTAPAAEPQIAMASTAPAPKSDYILRGELQRSNDKWEIQARLIEAGTGQVQWSGSYNVPSDSISEQLQQTRLTAGIGNPLAARINAITHLRVTSPESKIVVEQAAAFINQTNRERFAAAQDLLEKSHAANPDDVDIAAALSAHLMRGVAMVWYPSGETSAIEQRAKALLSDAVKREPNYIPVLQGYCRLLQTINEFSETLVVCQNALRFDPWDGLAMFQIGMAQLRLGRFEDALTTFERADAIDTPQVSRWTWPLGAGFTLAMMERYEQALPWLEQSRAITPASGRTDLLIAACLQALGREQDARGIVTRGLKLRPGTTGENVGLPSKNQSPRYNASAERLTNLMIAAGLPAK